MQTIWNELHALCQQAARLGEVPVAAAMVRQNEIIAIAHNEVEAQKNPASHAEMLAMQRATAILGNKFLHDCDLYVTLEPCAMCAGAIAHFRVRRLYFAAYDHKAGAAESGIALLHHPNCHHKCEIYGGIQETRFSTLLSNFFTQKR
jgi:tRNA(adenine34) deaminase